MSQPTGDHASGVKLASAYVEVNAHTKDGMRSVHDDLTGIEQHAQQVGDNSAASIVAAVTAAGEPAARGFTDKLHQFATSGSKTAAEQSAMGFGDTFVDSMKNSRLAQDADWLFGGFKENAGLYGAQAASSFHGRFIQLMAANRIDAANEAEKTGAAIGDATKRGIKNSVSGAAEGLGMGEMFNKASEGVGALGSKFGEAGEQAGSLGGKMAGLAAPLAMFASPEVLGIGGILAVIGAAGVLVDKMYELGESFEQSRNKLRIMTGATGEALAGMQNQVKGVYGATTMGLGDVTSIVGMVNTSFKDTGAGAQQLSTVISQLEARSGAIDLNTLGRGFRAFNVTGDAQAQVNVLEQLEAASQKTQIPINTLVESFARAAPIANQFHLSIGETVAVMSEFDQAGLAPQNTMFMLSKAAAEATKNHQDFSTVLQTTIDKIRNASSEQEKLDIAGGLVGKTSGRGGAAQLVQAVNEGLSLDPATLSQLQNVGPVIEDNFKATMTWGDQWTLFKHQMSDALEPTGTELHEKVANVMEGLTTFLGEHQAGIAQFVGVIVDGFEKGATAIGHLVQEALPSIKAAIDYMRPAFEQMEPSLIKLGQSLGPLGEALGRDVVPIVKALGEALIWALTESVKHLPPLLDALHTIVDALTDVFNYLHDHTVPAFKDLVDAGEKTKPVFKDLGIIMHDTFGPIVDVIKDIVTGLDKLYDGAKKVTDMIGKIHLPGIPRGSGPGLDATPFATPPAHGQSGLALGGYGGGDIVPAMLEPGEHVVTKEEVSAVGGQDNFYLIRSLIRHGILQQVLGFDSGGGVPGIVSDPQQQQQYHVAVPGKVYGPPDLSSMIAPTDTGGIPAAPVLPPGILVGSVKPGDRNKLEAGGKDYDILSQGHTGADLASKGAKGAEGLESLGQVGSWAGTAAEAVEPYSKLLGGLALPWDVLGATNWGLNAIGSTNLSPTERLQQWWANFSASPKDHASADKWNATKGSTPQNLHIPGTNTNLLDVFKSFSGYGGHSMFHTGGAVQRFATGGSVHPAGREKRERSWVLDRYKMSKPMPLHFQDGGGVAGYGGLNDVKALLGAESGRTPYVFGGYSPKGIDCSGLVAEAVEVYLGLPMSGGHPMATGSEAGWLASHGFQQGYGPEGSFRVGFYNGGEGGGHTALTLPDGTNAESGGSGGGVRLGGGAAGANNSEFTDHWYLPPREQVSLAGWSGSGSGGSGGYGGAGGSSGGGGGGGGGGGFGGTSSGGGVSGGATPDQISAMDSKVTAAQGRLDVANQRLQEAQNRPIKGDGYDAQAKSQASKDADIKRLTEERDRIQGDLDSTQQEQAGLVGSTDPKNMVAAKDRITEANQRLNDAQKKLDDDRADPKKKPSEITADENAVAAAKERVAKAEEHLQTLEDAPAKRGKGEGKGGGKGDGTDWGGLFGDTAMKAFGDNMIPGFSNPMDWGVTKSASALFKFFGSMLGGDGKGAADSLIGGGGGGFGNMVGGGGGAASPYVQGLMGQVPGYTPSSNPKGSGDINVTHQANYYGDIRDDGQHQQAKLAADKRTTNKTINPYRLVMT